MYWWAFSPYMYSCWALAFSPSDTDLRLSARLTPIYGSARLTPIYGSVRLTPIYGMQLV